MTLTVQEYINEVIRSIYSAVQEVPGSSCKCGDTDHFSDGIWCATLDEITYWMPTPRGPESKEKKLGRPKKTRREITKAFNSSFKNNKKSNFKFWA